MNNELFSLNFYEFFGCKSKEELHASVISNNKNTAVLNDFIAYYKNDIKSTAKYMHSPDDVIEYMQSLPKPKNDEISILCLDNKNAPIHIKTINAFENDYQTVLKEMLLAKTVGYIPFYNRNINPQIIEELKTKTEGLFQRLDYIEFNNATHKAFSSLTHAEFSYKPIESNITKENSLEYYPFNEVESFIGTNEFEDYFNYYFAEKSLGLHVDHDEKALKEHLKLKTQFDAYEVVGCILYDDKNEVIESKDLFKGGVNRSVVDTKILFSYIASNSNVKGFSLYHNHPSGSINPSKEDGDITNTIKQIAKNLNIEFKDHYVVGKDGVYSFKDSFGVDSISPLENETIVEDAKAEYGLVNDEKIKHQDGVEHKTDEKGNQFWYKNGVLHRDGDLPAVEYSNGEREWYKDGKLHRDGDKPAIIKSYGTKEWYKYGMRHRENDLPARENVNGNKSWYITGKLHREGNKPAIDRKYGFKDYYKNGVLHRDGDLPARENEEGEKEWYKKGKLHREGDKPAFIDWKGDKHWYINGERYRAGDKPTIECANGDKQWWKNGKVHRDNDKPAIEKANGDKQWYIKGRLHRNNDLPAIEREDGGKEWYKYGRRHRENDLPAIEHPDGYKEYYKNGKQYEYNDQAKENNSLENETIVEDAKGKYRLADEEKNKINSPSIVQQNAQMFLNSVKDKTAPFLGAESYGTNLVTIFPTAVKTMDAGRSFRGTNQLLMQIALNNMGSTDNAVISYEKAKEHGAGIVKGAKGINLTTYNTDTKKQTVYRYYPASSVYNGDRIPEHEQPKSNLTLRCSGSSVEEYLGVYLAATYSGAAFQATKDVVEAFRENLTKDLEASFNDNKHTRIFEIGNKASSVCQKTLDNIESQNTPKKKSDEMFMKSQHTPFNPVTGEVFVGSNEAKARRVMQVLKSTDPRFIDTADIKTLGLSLKTKAIIKEPELQINIEGKRRTFFNAIDIDGLPALAVNTASNKRENEVAL